MANSSHLYLRRRFTRRQTAVFNSMERHIFLRKAMFRMVYTRCVRGISLVMLVSDICAVSTRLARRIVHQVRKKTRAHLGTGAGIGADALYPTNLPVLQARPRRIIPENP